MFSILFLISLSFAAQYKDCNVPYCESCDTAGTCTECMEEYILKEGKCVFKRELGCEEYNNYGWGDLTSETDCRTCADGYKMNDNTNQCVECEFDELCSDYYVNYNNECVCSECSPGTKINKKGKCEIVDEFCESYGSDSSSTSGSLSNGGCQKCMPGYLPNYAGICERGTIDNCVYYKDEEMCESCIYNLNPIHGQCKHCYMENCAICMENDSGDYCAFCHPGYYITKEGECSECPSKCKNCESYVGRCYECEEGYRLNEDGKCEKCSIDNCMECSEKSCERCKKGYHEVEVTVEGENAYEYNICQKDDVEHCKNYNTNGKCGSCEEEYHLVSIGESLKCEKDNVEHCSKYNKNDGKCSECYVGYKLSDNKCVENDPCKDFYDEGNTVCIECNPGFYLKSDYTCGKCSERYSECIYEPEELIEYDEYSLCLLRDKDHKCVKCGSGYELKKGECEKIEEDKYCYQEAMTRRGKCSLCIAFDESPDEDELTFSHFYFPDEDTYRCGTTSMFLMMVLAIIALVF